MALQRKWIASPCYHGRDDSRVRLIVLHTAEGATTIESLGNFFANYGNQVSSHTGADDKKGIIGEYVTRGNAAWTAGSYNDIAVQLELCGFAAWSRSTWLNQHEQMLRNAAAWVAEEAKKFGIPIKDLTSSQATGGAAGVCEHVDISGPGGHSDCGPGFPMDKVIEWAKGGGGSAAPKREDEEVAQLLLDPEFRAALVFTNAQADGSHRLRFGCRQSATLRIDLAGVSETPELELANGVPVGCDIPKGCKYAVVKVDAPATGPTSPISYVVSD